mmetsp:Transcript_23883/g.40861  ORF Transcript_23883/g.40861 Transcript_23883/m.40861 type:complete len:121 (-) Transcript_23883:602-964(-)
MGLFADESRGTTNGAVFSTRQTNPGHDDASIGREVDCTGVVIFGADPELPPSSPSFSSQRPGEWLSVVTSINVSSSIGASLFDCLLMYRVFVEDRAMEGIAAADCVFASSPFVEWVFLYR